MPDDATARRRTPVHLWIVGVLSLLWNAIGAFDYTATELRLPWYLAQFTPEQLQWLELFPAWSIAAWALGVWGALLGSVLLLARSRWAVWAFAISLAGLAGSTLYQFVLSSGGPAQGTKAIIFNAVIWIIMIALLWYSVRQRSNGVLGPRSAGVNRTSPAVS